MARSSRPDLWKRGYSNDGDDTYRGVLHMGYCKRSASWDQVISSRVDVATSSAQRAPGPGLKLQAGEDSTANSTRGQVAEPQASSDKLDK